MHWLPGEGVCVADGWFKQPESDWICGALSDRCVQLNPAVSGHIQGVLLEGNMEHQLVYHIATNLHNESVFQHQHHPATLAGGGQ